MSLSPTTTGPWFLADHPALDFINTVAQAGGAPHDFWQSDEDVRHWLAQAGLATGPAAEGAPGELLHEARQLRDSIRTLVAQKKAGGALDVTPLNRALAAAGGCNQLVAGEDGALRITRVYPGQTPAQQLGPVAELAASLLADAHFERVRECEHPECTLWFYDKTKAHRRRWCSMALCGNRAKVARFRQQQK
jgi:predicted RNA-binding Zn ribbon-like protein